MTRTADVVIVGGGVVGTSVAWHLARAGAGRVLLLEREALLGTGTTRASAGGTRKLFTVEVNVRMSLESQEVVRALQDDLGYPVDLRRTGYLFLALSPADLAGYRATAALLTRLGVADVRLLSPSEVQALVPQLAPEGLRGGLHCASDGHLSPAALTDAFAREAGRAGAELVTGVPVVGIERAGNRVVAVRTPTERIETPVVVDAAGPHAGEIARLAGLAVPLTPRRRLIYVTRHDHGLADGMPMVFDFQTWFYCRREGPGVLIGTANTEEPPSLEATPDWAFLGEISPRIFRRLPCLADAEIETAWGGAEAYTPDGSALLGPTAALDGFILAAGFSGHGVMHAPAAGRILAALVLGQAVGYDVTDLDPDRFNRHAPRAREPIMGRQYEPELPEA